MGSVKRLSLRQINNGLIIVVILLSLYLLLAPFAPKVAFEVKDPPPLAKDNGSTTAIPDENTLVIPKMKLQETIYESTDTSALNKGVWHRPRSSTPENGGNTVLTGHRFTYGGPAVLYNLDKVQADDEVTIYWRHKKYTYRVETVSVVKPWSKDVEKETADPLLTIYTCTPLITAQNRLVIRAVPIGEDS